MSVTEFLLTPTEWADAAARWQAIGFVDLAELPTDAVLEPLPPFPVIGLGDAAHPRAAALDAVVEPPVRVEALVRQCTRNPKAAAAAVQLLRMTGGMAVEPALTAESLCYAMLQGSAEHRLWLERREPSAEAPSGTVKVERRGDVLDVVIDRPWARNAIDVAVRDRLGEAFRLAALDRAITRIALRSTGAAFSIGGDLAEFGTTRDPATAHLIRARTLPAVALAPPAGILDVHVQGACVGAGLEIAAFGRRVTASRSAWFQLPELAMGLIPGAGGCVSLPRRIGRQRAALLILSGRRIGADVARRWGLIDAIVDDPPGDDRGADEIGG